MRRSRQIKLRVHLQETVKDVKVTLGRMIGMPSCRLYIVVRGVVVEDYITCEYLDLSEDRSAYVYFYQRTIDLKISSSRIEMITKIYENLIIKSSKLHLELIEAKLTRNELKSITDAYTLLLQMFEKSIMYLMAMKIIAKEPSLIPMFSSLKELRFLEDITQREHLIMYFKKYFLQDSTESTHEKNSLYSDPKLILFNLQIFEETLSGTYKLVISIKIPSQIVPPIIEKLFQKNVKILNFEKVSKAK